MKHRSLLRLNIEINVGVPLIEGFWWSNTKGHEKWATIKYECLSDFCYGYGRLGHTSQHCEEEIIMSELKPGVPRYGPWLTGLRPRNNNK